MSIEKKQLEGDTQAHDCPACLSENTRFEGFWQVEPPFVTRDMHWTCYRCGSTWLQVMRYSLKLVANNVEYEEYDL